MIVLLRGLIHERALLSLLIILGSFHGPSTLLRSEGFRRERPAHSTELSFLLPQLRHTDVNDPWQKSPLL